MSHRIKAELRWRGRAMSIPRHGGRILAALYRAHVRQDPADCARTERDPTRAVRRRETSVRVEEGWFGTEEFVVLFVNRLAQRRSASPDGDPRA